MSEPNPTIAVHLTRRELELLRKIIRYQFNGTLTTKLSMALVDIRPIIREAKSKAKLTKRQIERQAARDARVDAFFANLIKEPEPYDGIMMGDDN